MRPNILVYFSDQQRPDTCGCFGQKLNITPNLDQLASEGCAFDNAFTPQPVCGPFRALLQTGRYCTDTGCFRNNVMLPTDAKTIAHYLTEVGYDTAYVGKWHLASDGDKDYNQRLDFFTTPVPMELRGGYNGFWRATDILEFTSHGYDGYVFDELGNKREFTGYRVDCLTDMALEFFDTYKAEKPFFMTISHIEPHHQNDRKHYEGPDGSKEKFADAELPADLKALGGGDAVQEYADYLGACESLDNNLGRVVSKLKEKGLYENTVIIYLSDHGCHFKTRNKDAHLNGGDDYKRTCHDSALRVPLVISGGAFKGLGHISDLVSTDSVPKTILAIAGIDVGNKMIGENLLNVATHQNADRPNRVFAQISESRVGRCIRTEEFLYSVYAPGVDGNDAAAANLYADDFLYDMKNDPNQLNNLIGDIRYTQQRDELRRQLSEWIYEAEGYHPMIVDACE